mmetsp:Transcript_16370/g.30557  ORF Transcript_16370/g.30557 Transcript_16370/m.30557 type:complete len:365 (+) Transcript_16370:355-1449(+)
MSYDEYLDALQIHDNCVIKRIFDKFMINQERDTLLFAEFFCLMWTMITIPDSMAGSFLHFVYDTEDHGKMELADMDELITDLKVFLDPAVTVIIHEVTPRKPKLAEEARRLDEYDMKKKILHTVRHGTDVIKADDGWTITACHKWSTFNPLVFLKFLEFKQHITKHVFGEAIWKHLSELRESKKEQGQVNFMLRLMQDLHHATALKNGKKINLSNPKFRNKHHKQSRVAPVPETTANEVGDLINEYKLTRHDYDNAKKGITYADDTETHPRRKKNMKGHVEAGIRRLSLTFGKDFNNSKAKHKKQYEVDMEKLHEPKHQKKKKKKTVKQSVTGTVRRLSVSMGLNKDKGKNKSKEKNKNGIEFY